jgi:hypothetical protein
MKTKACPDLESIPLDALADISGGLLLPGDRHRGRCVKLWNDAYSTGNKQLYAQLSSQCH